MVTRLKTGSAGRSIALLCAALIGCAASPERPADLAPTQTKAQRKATRGAILGSMKTELDRSVKQLRFKDYEAPYFVGYRLTEIEREGVTGKFGAVVADASAHDRFVYTEVRVGDYAFDNHANIDNESFRFADYEPDKRAPLGSSDDAALRGVLWLLTDDAYKRALSEYLTKKGGAVYATDEKIDVASFSKEEASSHRGPFKTMTFDRAAWSRRVARVTKAMRDAPVVLDAQMDVSAQRSTRYFVNTEGTEIVDEHVIYSIQIEAMARADDGMRLQNSRSFYAPTEAELPSDAVLDAEVAKLLTELQALRDAPTIDPYTGPAILMPEASGVLFHEAVGHRLEGERQADEEEGRTFKGRVGKVVIPDFLSVYDDPTVAIYAGTKLNGAYAYDDEGIASERVTLIEDGVLRGFLKSRTPIEDAPHSNGHGRAQGTLKPMARMANLIVEAEGDMVVPYADLKVELMAETRRQGKPYGLIIRDITGGSTNTSGYGYQAFKGEPVLIYKVDPETGVETLVRGAEIVGTPLVSINKIVGASKELGVFNGYCGAESGYVPVSASAPALLTTELELQRSQSNKERPPLLPAPWAAPSR